MVAPSPQLRINFEVTPNRGRIGTVAATGVSIVPRQPNDLYQVRNSLPQKIQKMAPIAR